MNEIKITRSSLQSHYILNIILVYICWLQYPHILFCWGALKLGWAFSWCVVMMQKKNCALLPSFIFVHFVHAHYLPRRRGWLYIYNIYIRYAYNKIKEKEEVLGQRLFSFKGSRGLRSWWRRRKEEERPPPSIMHIPHHHLFCHHRQQTLT